MNNYINPLLNKITHCTHFQVDGRVFCDFHDLGGEVLRNKQKKVIYIPVTQYLYYNHMYMNICLIYIHKCM